MIKKNIVDTKFPLIKFIKFYQFIDVIFCPQFFKINIKTIEK